ncbi:MAG TPA: ArdC-like ssDNA-binding domain-containing protein [Pyrinomonadaceae bacterium]|nr:ArdC-like ssDNA-binding domain-containing protein [Pyrinomonadaceae bacterium]
MKPHRKPQDNVPKWSSLLVEAVNKPGLIMDAYSAFHNYSIGNQILALVQCRLRGLEPGPINTFPGWQALGRAVKRGERALTLCMPITRKVRDDGPQEGESESHERILTTFIHKPRWFVLSQTVGEEFIRPCLPEWNAEQALAALQIEQISFTHTDGNCQGYARQQQIAINPVAQLPHKTLFHEAAHLCWLRSYAVLNQQAV